MIQLHMFSVSFQFFVLKLLDSCAVPFFSLTLKSSSLGGVRSVTTLQETLAAQVPEKQKKLAELKKAHGSHV